MATSVQVDRCFTKPVIPVLWDVAENRDVVALASSVILQGGPITELSSVVDQFVQPPLDHLRIFVHIDLVAGLETSEAGLELLAQVGNIDGVVSVHHHLTKSAKRLGFLFLLRIFLSDSRALDRGLKIATKARPNVVEILPSAAAIKVADDFQPLSIPYISGGLCRTEDDVRETISSGCRAVTSTRPALWVMNG